MRAIFPKSRRSQMVRDAAGHLIIASNAGPGDQTACPYAPDLCEEVASSAAATRRRAVGAAIVIVEPHHGGQRVGAARDVADEIRRLIGRELAQAVTVDRAGLYACFALQSCCG